MKPKQRALLSYIFSAAFYFGPIAAPARADDLADLKAEIRSLRQVVNELNSRSVQQQKLIDQLIAAKHSAGEAMQAQTATAPPSVSSPPVDVASKAPVPFIPDIGVVADVTGSLSESKEDEEGNDRFSVREVELVLGHDIDPYSRLDATITFSDFEDPDIEEAYISYWDLPGDLKGKIGRFRPKIGKASAQHRDALDTADEPFVVSRYLGVEGLFKSGLELSGFTPLSSELMTQQLAGGVIEGGAGEDGELLGESGRHPSLYLHLSNYFEINDVNNFELGGTYLVGSNLDDEKLKVHLFGVDASYNYYLTPINKLKLLSEAYFQNRTGNETDVAAARSDENPWGIYALADYRISERWGIGTRYDYVELLNLDDNPRDQERGFTGYLTFYQSEFARWRAQYQHALLEDGKDDDRFFLQGTFAIGTHKHQLQ